MMNKTLLLRLRIFVGSLVLAVVLVLFLYYSGKTKEHPDALLSRLEEEALAELSLEDEDLLRNGISPPSEPNERMIRLLNILLGKVDLMEESPAALAVARHVSESLARSLRESEERRTLLDQIARESIHESVQALGHTPFSRHFNPSLADPMRFEIILGSVSSAQEIKKDPRIQKLMSIAESGNEDKKAELLRALIESFDESQRLGEYKVCSGNCGYFQGPAMGVPLLLSMLDNGGDTLPLLVEMGDAYNRWLFGEYYEAEKNAMLNGKGPMTMYSGISAMAMEAVLKNLLETRHRATPALLEYVDTRGAIQEIYMKSPYRAEIEKEILADTGVMITEMSISELQHYSKYLEADFSEWKNSFPSWFQPGNIEWAIMAMGKRVSASLGENN